MSDDLIRRSDALRAIELQHKCKSIDEIKRIYYESPYSVSVDFEETLLDIYTDVQELPTAEPKRGEWKRKIVDNGFNADWVCSECGYRVKTDFVDYNFCPNCGADMRGRDDE